MTDILYKYRSLENFKNFVDILLNNRLFASKYKDLNDPMEGQYYYQHGLLDKSIRDILKDEKSELRICSLSRSRNNELMWSHYADGQKGVAIGLRIDDNKYTVKPILYNGLANLQNQNLNEQSAIEILSHKLEVWNYEQEERAFVRDKHFIEVKIEEIITGRTMGNSDFGMIRELVDKINPEIKIVKANSFMD
jgi:hypothetical protein